MGAVTPDKVTSQCQRESSRMLFGWQSYESLTSLRVLISVSFVKFSNLLN